MNTRASRAVPFYIFLPSSFFRAKWHKFCYKPAPFKSRRREKCFDLGTNRHRESLWCELFRRSPSQNVQRVFLARVPFIVLYILSLPSPFCQFCSPLIFPPLLHAAPSPRRPSLSFRPSLSLPSLLLIRPIRPIRLIRAIIRVQKKFLSDLCANALPNCHLRFTNRTPKPPQSPSKAEKRRFSQIF